MKIKEYLYLNEQNGETFILAPISILLCDCTKPSFFEPFSNEGEKSWVTMGYVKYLEKECKITHIGTI